MAEAETYLEETGEIFLSEAHATSGFLPNMLSRVAKVLTFQSWMTMGLPIKEGRRRKNAGKDTTEDNLNLLGIAAMPIFVRNTVEAGVILTGQKVQAAVVRVLLEMAAMKAALAAQD